MRGGWPPPMHTSLYWPWRRETWLSILRSTGTGAVNSPAWIGPDPLAGLDDRHLSRRADDSFHFGGPRDVASAHAVEHYEIDTVDAWRIAVGRRTKRSPSGCPVPAGTLDGRIAIKVSNATYLTGKVFC